jgi:hypothetical protein
VSDPAQQARLRAVKLRALVRDHGVDVAAAEPGDFAGGAALVIDSTAWVLAEITPARALGPALAWTLRRGCTQLNLLAPAGADTGTLARRAAEIIIPVHVWEVHDRDIRPAAVAPLPTPPVIPESHRAFADLITAAGATVVEEHGVLAGEVDGLEVCRVVDDPHSGVMRLEVGVGAHDREAFQMVHGDRPTLDALRDVVAAVSEHRREGARQHPFNVLAAERAVRAKLQRDPHLVGASSVRAVAPPVPRPNIKDNVPCVAVAIIDGVEHTMVISHGVDLDLVPFSIDARRVTGITPTIAVVRPRDRLPVQQLLADAVSPAVALLAIDDAAADRR